MQLLPLDGPRFYERSSSDQLITPSMDRLNPFLPFLQRQLIIVILASLSLFIVVSFELAFPQHLQLISPDNIICHQRKDFGQFLRS